MVSSGHHFQWGQDVTVDGLYNIRCGLCLVVLLALTQLTLLWCWLILIKNLTDWSSVLLVKYTIARDLGGFFLVFFFFNSFLGIGVGWVSFIFAYKKQFL